jgi:pimeloyl-ACP methyl ester carboxylesterase
MASSLTAAFVIRIAARNPSLYAQLVLIEPTGIEKLSDEHTSLARRLGYLLLSSPLLGESIYNLLCSRPSIRYLLRTQIYADPTLVSDDMIDVYHTMAHQPGGRHAIASFISGSLNTSVAGDYSRLRHPILLCWGKDSPLSPLENVHAFRRDNIHAELRIFDCGSMPQDEAPEEFVDEVRQWKRATSTPIRY